MNKAEGRKEMNKEEGRLFAARFIKMPKEVQDAYIQGKTIQHRVGFEWYDLENPRFECSSEDYRVKPEVKVIPWTLGQVPVGMMIFTKTKVRGMPTTKLITGSYPMTNEVTVDGQVTSLQELLELYETQTGRPCGQVIKS